MDPKLNKSLTNSPKSNKPNISLDISISSTDISEPVIKSFEDGEDGIEPLKTKSAIRQHMSTKTRKKKKKEGKIQKK